MILKCEEKTTVVERGAGRNRAVNEHFKQRTCNRNRNEARGIDGKGVVRKGERSLRLFAEVAVGWL